MDERQVGIAAGIVAVVAAFLPWAKVSTIFGTVTVAGTEGDGMITAIGGGLAVAGFATGTRKARTLAMLCGIAIVGIGLYDQQNVSRMAADVNSEGLVRAAVGYGLWFTLAAGIVIAIVAGRQLRSTDEPLPPPTGQPIA